MQGLSWEGRGGRGGEAEFRTWATRVESGRRGRRALGEGANGGQDSRREAGGGRVRAGTREGGADGN